MKNMIMLIALFYLLSINIQGQTDSVSKAANEIKVSPYEISQAFEIESLVPMFITGGYHFGIGYRYNQFRLRLSVINGGTYNAEPAGLKNSSSDFKRYYKTSPGIFLGYNVWKGLEIYTYLESHTFSIEQKATGIKKDIHSADFGGGISYQYFIGDYFYVQPGAHIYLRKEKEANFGSTVYRIPTTDLSLVLRLGFRLWSI